jgi:acetyl esterase/lipase
MLNSSIEEIPADVADEARAFNARLEALLATQPPIQTLPPQSIRDARRAGQGLFPAPIFHPEVKDLMIPARSGSLRLRIARPTTRAPAGVYLHLHGGGWMLGAADLQDTALMQLANAVGVVAASVDYRLSPEHPYPAAPDDCEDAARWLIDQGSRALEAPPVFTIGGESAGAHLAAVTLLRLRDRAGAFCAANLVYGAYDLSMTPSVRAWGKRYLVLSLPIIEYFTGAFTRGMSIEDRRVPDVSPLFADLRGMPPALFTVGMLDPLLDDTLFMEARWRIAGGRTELRVWPDAIHGFNGFPLRLGAHADAAQHDFLSRSMRG